MVSIASGDTDREIGLEERMAKDLKSLGWEFGGYERRRCLVSCDEDKVDDTGRAKCVAL